MENYWRKVAEPCGDCVEGWCTMNCSSAAAPEPKAPRYTVGPQGGIYDAETGHLFHMEFAPYVFDERSHRLRQRIADLLNQHGEG